ncbi:YggS family pyridoxal phosphate-dependent enzyme [Ostreibacterium oceani]|uniref:Pyridoxal phosphate homeostasis protein n=1 Tax=Ostreibacterium oceani TaxID=2654998 RepID=A0A6N7F4C7_9GAMM|nr:YggS family pyridoxal phosphate-dependent enzyme [Ostreibacterium oceani]MPV86746.1 YggS family pyridoxal phosphate-dependent enzyme [Ostreibacterium oceani]
MITERLAQLQSDIAKISEQNSQTRPLLLAVSKCQPVARIREAVAAGQYHFGENYLQEAIDKQAIISNANIVWHYIGAIQSNKTKKIAAHFDWVHTVSDIKTAKRLSGQRPEGQPALQICLQINIDNEASKAGILPDKAAILTVVKAVSALPNIQLRGLMCIPAPKTTPEAERATFEQMQALLGWLQSEGYPLDTLSMGMSDDMASAIACGATIVRVGTAIFGARSAA